MPRMDLTRFPRRRYTPGPTPLEFLPRFTRVLGGPQVWIKRDDLLGLSPGGNKTRKLEFLVAEALAQGADTLVTCGAPQSNHCRITLAAAVKEGLSCRFVIEERVANSYRVEASGNNFLFRLMGVEAITVVPAGTDMAVAMAVLDAQIELLDASGATRRVAIGDFHRLPENTPHIETVLKTDEMITGVLLPAPVGGRQLYRKVRDRASYAFALVSVAVVVATERGTITFARVAFGGVAHKPWRSNGAEAVLAGRPATMATYWAAAEVAMAHAMGRGHNDFKIELAKRTLCRTLAHAAQGG